MHRSAIHLLAGGALVLASTACGGEQPLIGDPFAGRETVYDCRGVAATASELRQAPSVAELRDQPAAQAFAEHVAEPAEWRAVVVQDDELAAIRELDAPDELDGEVRDHERKVVTRLDEPAPPETDDDGWLLSSSGPCALRADLGVLESATVSLQDGAALDEEATELHLLVTEQGCASGESAAGRVEVMVDADQEQIRLVAGVEPRRGDQSCPNNPATPITVDLDEPVGHREIVDAGRYPPRGIR